jgi:DNA-binding winged helix-turn-helix (wHTH) protein
MKFLFDQTIESQIKLYIKMSCSVVDGFYSRTHSVLLPQKVGGFWYFPDLGLFQDDDYIIGIKRILDETQNIRNRHYFHIPEVFEKVKSVFPNYLVLEEDATTLDKTEFLNFQDILISTLNSTFEGLAHIQDISITKCAFGTDGSFGILWNNEMTFCNIYIYYRTETRHKLVETIVLAIIQSLHQIDQSNIFEWKQRKSILDFLMKHSSLRNISLEKCVDKSSSQNSIELMAAKYMQKLGYPYTNVFSFDEQNVYFGDIALVGLSAKEYLVLKQLISKRNLIVSFDEIAEICWGETWREKFSLESLAKVIEKLRKRLKDYGILYNVIITIRKQGYALID